MNDRHYKTISIVLTVLLIFNTWQLIQIKQNLNDLTYE